MMYRSVAVSMLLFLAVPAAVADTVEGARASYQRQDYIQALQNLLPLAEAGDAEAQYYVGYMYGHGQGTRTDQARALAWFKTSADQNYAEAEFSIGLIYDEGRGVPQDYHLAMQWYLKAAGSGLARAENNIGNLYNDGLGIAEDYPRAHMWYALSAAQGDERAARNAVLLEDVMTAGQISDARKLELDWIAAHPVKFVQP